MVMGKGVRLCVGFLSASALTFGSLISAYACSRVVHVSQNGELIVTGRNMDWFEDTQSNLFVFPKGIKRNGAAGDNSAAWTSKYGSVATAGFDVSTADGLNEAGLMANLLYLGEADFGDRDVSRPGLSWSAWAQYFLDNFATVAEAVTAMKGDEIQIVASPLPGSVGKRAGLRIASFAAPSMKSSFRTQPQPDKRWRMSSQLCAMCQFPLARRTQTRRI
jgi:choloylglycine hydrolase